MQRQVAQARILMPRKQRFAFLPERLMGVHAAAVVPKKRFGHQGDGLAMLAGHVLEHVFVEHHVVGGLDQRVEAEVDLRLARSGHFMVLALDLDAQLLHRQAHLGADVLLRVQGRDGEIAFFVADFVAQVGHLLPPGVPDGLFGIDGIKRAVGFGVELHVVKDEEFGFRTEDRAVSDAGGQEVFFGPLGDAARIAGVGFLGAGLGDGAGQREGGGGHEGVDEGGGRIGHGQHVAGFDRFPAADRRAVEAQAIAEGVFGQFADRQGEVLPGAEGIDELHVHHLRALLSGQLQHLPGAAHGVVPFYCFLHLVYGQKFPPTKSHAKGKIN